jgi:hypothetical protein
LEKDGEYDLDFDHQFIESEKYDSKTTYKKYKGYGPRVAVINDFIVGVENRDDNANVRFHQGDTLERIFARLEARELKINRSRMGCSSCSEEIVGTAEKHCRYFYIRANRCASLYDEIFALRGWHREEINGQVFELNSILVEKWKGRHTVLLSSANGESMENSTSGRGNTLTDASLPTTRFPRHGKSWSSTTCVVARNAYSMR